MTTNSRISRQGDYAGQKLIDPADTKYQREQDEWQAEYWRAIGIAVAWWIERSKLSKRRLDSLTIDQYIGMGEAACAEHIKQRAARRQVLKLKRQDLDPMQPDDMESISMG